jgi:uncharacterized protein (DUF697 family)
MNKKKSLPKAVFWTADDMRKSEPKASHLHQVPHSGGISEFPGERGLPAASESNVIDMMSKPENATESVADSGALRAKPDVSVKRRRMQANAIVERHANLSAIGGVIPLPFVTMAAVTVIVVRMARSLSKLYSVPFERNRTRTIVIGLLGGVMPTGVATIATSALIYAVPGYNLLGLAASAVTASAYARAIGQMFIEHFEKGDSLLNFHSAVLR